MRKIYIMDNAMPIQEDYSSICSFDDVLKKEVSELNTLCTSRVLDWARGEFQKMFQEVNIENKFDLDGLFVTFFKSYFFNVPEAFFNSRKKLLGIKLDSYDTGEESNIQKSAIHELTHAATGSHSVIGVAAAEGIALLFESLFCEVNDIPDEDDEKRDEGYLFGRNLIECILSNVYNNDFDLFSDRIKRGNEEDFLSDIDGYLKSKNILYNAKELLRLSSILYYAKKIPDSPFSEYEKNAEMEMIRNEILGIFSDEDQDDNLCIYNYLSSIKYVNGLCEVFRNNLSNSDVVCTTLDRELGLLMVQKGSSMLLDNQEVINVVKKTLDITGIKDFDFNVSFDNNSTSYPRK